MVCVLAENHLSRCSSCGQCTAIFVCDNRTLIGPCLSLIAIILANPSHHLTALHSTLVSLVNFALFCMSYAESRIFRNLFFFYVVLL